MKVIKHKLIKIVVIFFVGSFLLFPPAYSEMIDLKEGFDWTDYALTMAIGAFQAYTASVDESISMVLLKNFVIPVAADKATENINNSLLRATVRGALIAGSTGWLDYKSAATQT
ncbi:MAG: hypothetical protein KKD55_05840, partial [Candidatus Omnitrophica bacterium]|nr:hypothetical protein [Candidatus Omnitrophota bacterium]